MPPPLVAAYAAVTIGSAILGGIGGIGANKKAAKATRLQADLTMRTREEEMRRAKIEGEQLVSHNRAAVFASNIQMSGSAQASINALQTQIASDMAWRRDAAVLEQRAIMAGAPGKSADLQVLGRAGTQIGAALLGI